MMKFIDNQLNSVTTYRLVLYYLILLFTSALLASGLGLLALDPIELMFSLGLLLAACWITNTIFARTFGIPANVESVYISALILSLIIAPPRALSDITFILWAGVLAMASKYIIAYKGKHIFNPVAFAVALTYFTLNLSANWWIGSPVLLPITLIGGLLVVRKLGRFDLLWSFLGSALLFMFLATAFTSPGFLAALQNTMLYSPLLFFAFIILTEPLTAPPTRQLRIAYGFLIGFLFTPQLHFGSLYITPELAILSGNIYAFMVSPKLRLKLRLLEKVRVAPNTYEFTFALPRRMKFRPGQYMEWTLAHRDPDSRGNRRYFTLASSPSENVLRLGVRFNSMSSSYKRRMLEMNRGAEIVASQLDGDFVLPSNTYENCVFIAGGIGITPFRSMLKYLLDTHQRRPITLLYAVKSASDIVYRDVLDRAERELGIKTVYSISEGGDTAAAGAAAPERIDAELIRKTIPNFRTSLFYISGSRRTVENIRSLLTHIGVPKRKIKTDFFAGLA